MAKKILIVEDDKMLLTIFQMFVQELGYEIAGLARTGDEAIAAASEGGISCVLMDIQLDGDIDGVETARRLSQALEAPVIFVSGGMELPKVSGCVGPNVYGFLSKPLYRQSLGVSIEFACAKFAIDRGIQVPE